MKHLQLFIFLFFLTFAVSCGQQKKYIEYKVKEGETMRTIANNLDMKTKDLLRLNPNISRRPAKNTVIIIPNKKMTNTNNKENKEDNTKNDEVVNDTNNNPKEEDNTNNSKDILLKELKKKFVVHLVKPKETMYGLTRFYNVTTEELLALNPELSEGLKIGQIIKIKPLTEGEETENTIYEDIIKDNISLKIALLLPFRTNEYDSILHKNIFKKSKLANIVTDFYLGAEIAIDSIRKQGVEVQATIFDTQKNSTKINTILAENNLNTNDAIIGPFYFEEALVVAKKVEVPVIFPMYSKKQSQFSSEEIVKTAPNKNIFREELVNYIKNNFNNGNLILVGDGKLNSNKAINQMQQSLIAHDSIKKVHILKPKKGYIKKERFLEILQPNVKNWVAITTNDDVMVADAINSLISLPDSTSVKVFTFDKGKAYNNVDNLKLGKIGFTYVSDKYVNNQSPTTQLFNKQYYAKNNALPSFYATRGFDITYDILIRLASGSGLKNTFTKGASFRVEAKFDYTNKPYTTTENNGLFIVQYNEDLSLTRLK